MTAVERATRSASAKSCRQPGRRQRPLGSNSARTTLEFLDHNELGLAFDCLVDLGDDLGLPLSFWQHLDRAVREMRLYSDALHKPHLTAADLCHRHLAAASEDE